MVGYIRNEMNFTCTGNVIVLCCYGNLFYTCIEELITAIKNDIKFAEMKLSNVPLSHDELNFFGKTQT